MLKAFYVTGTDTEVGKTFVSCALLHAVRQSGVSALGLKPVAAGCEHSAGGLRNEDAIALIDAVGGLASRLRYEDINPIALEPPVAPHIAAREAGVSLSAAALADHCRSLLLDDGLTLVEGAGGWLVPLNETETLADFARQLGLSVILVVGLRLGCINHALLSAESIERAGLTLAGWVGNEMPEGMSRQAENLQTLKARLPAPCLGIVPRLAHASDGVSHLKLEALLPDRS